MRDTIEGALGMRDIIEEVLDDEIAFARETGMPQFVMGLMQAKKIVLEAMDKQVIDKQAPKLGDVMKPYLGVGNGGIGD